MRPRILRVEPVKRWEDGEWYVELSDVERIVNVVLVRPQAVNADDLMEHSVAIIDTGWGGVMTASNSSVQLSLKRLRNDSRFTRVEVVERFISFPAPGHRADLFGIIDVLAIGPGITLAVQCTTRNGESAHKKKIFEAAAAADVLRAGWLLELHAWSKPKYRWECRVTKVQLGEELPHGEAEPGQRAFEV